MKKVTTWIIVADHQHARVYANDGPGRGLQPVAGLDMETHLEASHNLGTHQPDSAFASARSGAQHRVEPRTDPHREAGKAFIKHVVNAVAAAAARSPFDRLVLVAPPRALGELRRLLPHALRNRITGELVLDLTKALPASIETHLADHLAI